MPNLKTSNRANPPQASSARDGIDLVVTTTQSELPATQPTVLQGDGHASDEIAMEGAALGNAAHAETDMSLPDAANGFDLSEDAAKLAGGETPAGPANPRRDNGRIKSGEVRNRWGRAGKPRPGVTSEFDAEFAKALTQPIVNTKTGEELSPAQVAAKTLVNGMAKGDFRYFQLYLSYQHRFSDQLLDDVTVSLDSDHRALLAESLARLLAAKVAGSAHSEHGPQNGLATAEPEDNE